MCFSPAEAQFSFHFTWMVFVKICFICFTLVLSEFCCFEDELYQAVMPVS